MPPTLLEEVPVSAPSPDDVRVTVDGPVMELVFNRPSRRNAIHLDMYTALSDSLMRAAFDPTIRVVLIWGEGGMFTSGNDLKDFMQNPPGSGDSPVLRFLTSLLDFPKPLVAAVDGPAIGIGTTLLLHCDLVYAAESARLHLPFVNLALVPEAGASYLLPRMMGHVRSAELLLLGEPFTAETARELGIVNEVLPSNDLLARARARCRELASRPPEALRLAKELMRAPYKSTLTEAMQKEGIAFIQRLASDEVAEAITAFFEKRAPDFSRFS